MRQHDEGRDRIEARVAGVLREGGLCRSRVRGRGGRDQGGRPTRKVTLDRFPTKRRQLSPLRDLWTGSAASDAPPRRGIEHADVYAGCFH
jgi:hypothetical protein